MVQCANHCPLKAGSEFRSSWLRIAFRFTAFNPGSCACSPRALGARENPLGGSATAPLYCVWILPRPRQSLDIRSVARCKRFLATHSRLATCHTAALVPRTTRTQQRAAANPVGHIHQQPYVQQLLRRVVSFIARARTNCQASLLVLPA